MKVKGLMISFCILLLSQSLPDTVWATENLRDTGSTGALTDDIQAVYKVMIMASDFGATGV